MTLKDKELRFKQDEAILNKQIEDAKARGDKLETQRLQNQISAKRNRLKNWMIQEYDIPNNMETIKLNLRKIESLEALVLNKVNKQQSQKIDELNAKLQSIE